MGEEAEQCEHDSANGIDQAVAPDAKEGTE